MQTLGLFYSRSKRNRYLATVLQRIHQSVIVIYGYAVDHSVPQLFVELDGRSFKFSKFREHTADGYGLGFHSVAPCGELFVLFLLGAKAVGEVIVTAAVLVLGDQCRGVLHQCLPYHFGEEIHLPLAICDVFVDEIGIRQRFLHIPKGVEGCLAVGKVDGEHFKELLLKLRFGEVGGGTFNLVMELVDALPHQTAVLVGGVPGDGRISRSAITAEDLCGERRVAEGSPHYPWVNIHPKAGSLPRASS